ncbi:benzoate/H(+) symporter BenE family transporter [Rhodococcus sp. NPDC080181]|uniref:benzoate/H(+) symporter BenE family transporter n=1 Tax=Rhodococcus sp. NPDC080181 TaxID=3155292 RepID=UPI0034502DFD
MDPVNSDHYPHASRAQPVTAGIVTALVGFTSSFAVVLTGLRAVGASDTQAASGLLALCVVMGLGIVFLASRYRIPITLAWSTPGAALLAGAGSVVGGWPAALGAFVLVGVAIVLTGLIPKLSTLIAAIPVSLAQAMLAGILLPLCTAPISAVVHTPQTIAPVVITWLILQRFYPRWSVLAAFTVAAIVIAVDRVASNNSVSFGSIVPRLELVMPQWTWQAAVALALPLYVVTMASQNVPGSAVMASYGYTVPWRSSMVLTGIGTAVAAPAGAHAINLAAISAALAADEQAHPDPRKRWIAALTAGWAYLLLGGCSAALAALIVVAPAGIVETIAGLALFGTLASALTSALHRDVDRHSAAITFVVAASGVSAAGIGSAFWALIAGLAVHALGFVRRRPCGSKGHTSTGAHTAEESVA